MLSLLLTSLAIIGLVAMYLRYRTAYPLHPYLSGWVLFAVMLVLTFFNLRKRVPFLRLGSVRLWLQLHLYIGVFSGALFLVHCGGAWPGGLFNQLLAGSYVIVFLTGVLGLWISRAFPKMLTVAGYETPYERIPYARRSLREQAEDLVLAGVDGQTSPVLADFYTRRLGIFFTKPCDLWAHLRQSNAPKAVFASQFEEVQRYAKKSERELLDQLRNLVSQKHLLDYQYALQTTLRVWLFVHVPLSYSLLIFSVVHLVLVHAFSGFAL